jgi:hypothetical protein
VSVVAGEPTTAAASMPELVTEATALAHAAITSSLDGDQDRVGECVYAMLANPVQAMMCAMTLVQTCRVTVRAMAQAMDIAPEQAWALVAQAVASAQDQRLKAEDA